MIKATSYFLSFIEEGVLNPAYSGYIGGRIEVTGPGDIYPSEEIRFFTKDVHGFYQFRERYDFIDVTEPELAALRAEVATKWHDKT
jgi:hypothetical protein